MALEKQGLSDDKLRHKAKAREYLAEIRTEAGTDELLERSDLKPIAEASPASTP
jgi:hypothetical protein